MAIDFDAIKAKLNRLSGANKNRNVKWKPEEGQEYTIRIIAFPDNDGQPFKEVQWYFGIPNVRGFVAPSQFGKRDPVQELIAKLRDEGTKESYEMAKKLYPSMRTYAAVVVRGQESEGVKIWDFGKTVYQKLLTLMLDEDYGDITDPVSGRDIKVTNSKAPGKKYADTDVTPRGKVSKLSNDPKQAADWLASIPKVEDLYSVKSYDEISGILEAWINGDQETIDGEGTEHGTTAVKATASSQDDDEDEAPPRKASATSTSGNKKKSADFGNLDDAFADLMS
jgi:hypothetical protein